MQSHTRGARGHGLRQYLWRSLRKLDHSIPFDTTNPNVTATFRNKCAAEHTPSHMKLIEHEHMKIGYNNTNTINTNIQRSTLPYIRVEYAIRFARQSSSRRNARPRMPHSLRPGSWRSSGRSNHPPNRLWPRLPDLPRDEDHNERPDLPEFRLPVALLRFPLLEPLCDDEDVLRLRDLGPFLLAPLAPLEADRRLGLPSFMRPRSWTSSRNCPRRPKSSDTHDGQIMVTTAVVMATKEGEMV